MEVKKSQQIGNLEWTPKHHFIDALSTIIHHNPGYIRVSLIVLDVYRQKHDFFHCEMNIPGEECFHAFLLRPLNEWFASVVRQRVATSFSLVYIIVVNILYMHALFREQINSMRNCKQYFDVEGIELIDLAYARLQIRVGASASLTSHYANRIFHCVIELTASKKISLLLIGLIKCNTARGNIEHKSRIRDSDF